MYVSHAALPPALRDPMTLSERLTAWRAAAPNFRDRQTKHLRQLREGWQRPQQFSFVFGCQRSGTKMLMRILDESLETRIWHENNALAFQDFELRPDPVLRALGASSPARCQIFKPICDSQRADQLLGAFPSARGLWIYRAPGDVARSAVQKWGAHQRDVVNAIAEGDLEPWGWRTRDLPGELVEAVRAVHRPDLTEHEGALLFWWIRNSFYFSRGLDQQPRMLLVKYEDLALDPDGTFPAVFEHVGARFEPRFTERVHAGSVRGGAGVEASPEIQALCDELLTRLDERARVPARPPMVSPVLMLINTLWVGGAERYVVMVSNWMAERGAEVTVAAERGDFAEELAPAVTFEDIPLHNLRLGVPRAAARIAGLLHRRPAAVIVAHSLVTTWVARIASAGRGIPIVNVAHGWPEDRYPRVAPLLRAADLVVAVSPDVRDKLVAAGLDPARCEVVQNGIDSTLFGRRAGEVREAARAAMGAGPDDILVVNVGRLSAQKAQHHVFTIADRLRESHPRLKYAIVGTGEREEELAAALREAGVQDRVRLLGVRRDIPDLLGSADLFLSCSDWEGMPLTTIEAMVAGLPSVATRTEGTTLLLSEECGFVVPVGDIEGLAHAIAALADDPPLRERMGAAARVRALERFGHDRVARELTALLEGLVRGGSR